MSAICMSRGLGLCLASHWLMSQLSPHTHTGIQGGMAGFSTSLRTQQFRAHTYVSSKDRSTAPAPAPGAAIESMNSKHSKRKSHDI